MNAQDLISLVDAYSGQAAYALPLLGRPGAGGLDLALGAGYFGGTLATATGWNQDRPTGAMGLGWSLGRERIVALRDQSALDGDVTYVLQSKDVAAQLVCTGVAADGSSTWASSDYRFWKISYDPAREIWTLIDEDGLVRRFGDSASGRGTVDWGIAWGGWQGPSASARGQRAVPVAWSLGEIEDLFGNLVTYSYSQDLARVSPAGMAYTQASYLSSVTGTDGAVLLLTYAAKDPNEYQDPHASPPPPNGWQDRYETRYLSKAALSAPDGSPVASVQLGYGTDLGSGGLTKRLLKSVTRLSAAGEAVEPATLFSYYGEGGGDGVSEGTIQAGSALYGALKTVTLPAGGTLTYAYGAAPLAFASRSLTLTPPNGWTSPVVHAGDDQLLVTWLAGTTAHVMSYVWEGRWIGTDVIQAALGSAAYSTLQVAAGPDCCAARVGATVYAAERDVSTPGGWFPAASFTTTPSVAAAEAGTLVCGRGFAALLGHAARNLLAFRFTAAGIGSSEGATGWIADAAVSIGGQGSAVEIAARDSVLAALDVPASGPGSIRLTRRLPSGAWSEAATAPLPGGLAGTGLALQCGSGFAVASAFAASGSGFAATHAACWWDAAGSAISTQLLPAGFDATAEPPVLAGNTVVVGLTAFRFTGSGWNSFALGMAGAVGNPALSVGPDAIARRSTTASGGSIADLLVYDPLAGSWSVPAGLSVTASGSAPIAAVAAQSRNAVSSYAVVGTKLWVRSASGTWSAALTLPSGLTAADLATITLLGDDYLVFQQGTGTLAYLLKNGEATAAPASPLAGQQIAAQPSGPLVSRLGFVTFTGTYGAAGSQLALYRPVFGDVGGAQTGYAVASVTADSGYSDEAGAAGQVAAAFGYQAGSVDGAGTVPRFNTTTAVPGQSTTAAPANGTFVTAFYNGLVAGESPATPYPSGSNAAARGDAMLGVSYQVVATATGAGATQSTVEQTIASHTVTLLPLGTGGVGAYHRPMQQSVTQDGVTRSQSFTWDPASGMARSLGTTVVNAAGGTDAFSETFTYFYEKYASGTALNLLSPMVQRVRQSQPAGAGSPATIGIDVVAWRNWTGSGSWAPERVYAALSAGVIFAAWDSGQTPPATDFRLLGQVTGRAGTGLPIETIDALGTRSSLSCDTGFSFAVSGAANCPLGQAIWYGCEPYETSGAWTTNAPGRTIADYLTGDDYHSGTQCLALPAGSGATGPLLSLVPADQTRRYLFSCWARTDPAFLPASGLAIWTLTLFNPATLAAVGTPVPLVLTPASGTVPTAVGSWSYFQATIDWPAQVTASGLSALGVRIQATNANTSLPCFVDELRFMPLDCDFAAAVADPTSLRPTATIDGNGQSRRLFYDRRDRPAVSVGRTGAAERLIVPTWSRWTTGGTSISPANPNLILALGAAVAGIHYDFHDGSSADWTFGNAASWAISGGTLNFSGSSADTATCKLLSAPNQAARVTVSQMSAAAGASVALGNGGYAMRWTNGSNAGSGQWTLEASGQSAPLATNASAPFDSEWLFAAIDGAVFAFAGSTQLFAYNPATAPTFPAGKIALAATAPARFDDLTILQDPSFTLAATDGLGREFWRLDLLGYQPAGGSVLFPGKWVMSAAPRYYDALGRDNVSGQALEAALQLAVPSGSLTGFSLVVADQATYLTDPAGNALTLPTYLAGTSGHTRLQLGYEASPLARPAALDGPRSAYSAGTYYCTQQIRYGSSTTVGNAPASGSGAYRVVLRQALRQNSDPPSPSAPAVTVLDQTTFDSAGRVLMRQSGPAGGTLLSTGYGYDAAGRLATIVHPNYYAPPAGSTAANWQESLAYDFLGQLVSRTAPDSGMVQTAYDSLGRTRFVYLASGAPAQSGDPATILFASYDALGRVTQSGLLRDSRYGWGSAALTAKLDVPAFPTIVTTPSGPNDATGSVARTTAYDTDGSFTGGASFARFLVGRPASVTIAPTDGAGAPDVESYGYDAAGNVAAKTLTMPGLSPAGGWTTRCTYNLAGQLLSIAYPNAAATAANPNPSGTPPTVGYGYDRLGRLAAVGGQPTGAVVDPAHPPLPLDMSYAGYGYDNFGRPQQSSYNNGGSPFGNPIARTFSYDSNQRLSGIATAYFTETLLYDSSASLTGWSWFGQAVAEASTAYPPSPQSPQPPASFKIDFSYDGYGRIAAAANDLGAAFSLTMGAGGSAYDSNGNILGKTVGASTITYGYAPPAGQQPSNRVTGLVTAANASVDFTQTTPAANGWVWGSSNNGPSASALTTTTPVAGSTQALMLAGGSQRHYERLRLATWLTPGLTYTLSWSGATGAGYPTTPTAATAAAWYAVLIGEEGPFAAVPLQTLAASATSWAAGTATIDLSPANIALLAGEAADVSAVAVELRNRCTGAAGAAGASVFVKNAGVAPASSPGTASTYGYDPDGKVASASGRGLGQISYDRTTGLTTSLAIGSGAGASSLKLGYGADGRRSRATVTPTGGTASRTVTFTAPGGALLATQIATGSSVAAAYYVNGTQGPFARQDGAGGPLRFLLQDRLGSLRSVVDGPSGALLAARDYAPFGSIARGAGDTGTDLGFTGQRRDDPTGLLNYNARLYDPLLGRFYATDPAREYASPYTYVGNDPVNLVDPSGTLSQELQKIIDDEWRDAHGDLFIVSELSSRHKNLLHEYYFDALPNVIWKRFYNTTPITVAFGRNDDDRLLNFTQWVHGDNRDCDDNSVKYYICFPGQNLGLFGKNEAREYFLEFLRVAMKKSHQIYVNLAGVYKDRVIDLVFANPDAITYFHDMSSGYNGVTPNSTSAAFVEAALPSLAAGLRHPAYLGGLIGGGLNKTHSLYPIYLPGHTAWELATIISNSTLRAKTTFFNDTVSYTYSEIASLIEPGAAALRRRADPNKDEL